MKGITILLVEDDFLNRRQIKKVLNEAGYTILEAKNSHQAIELLLSESLDLIILDINLGDNQVDGISLAKHIQENFEIPFIYLSAYETTEIIQKAINTSPVSYLTKPFKNTDLTASVAIATRKPGQSNRNLPSIRLKDQMYEVQLPMQQIDYIVSEGNYLLVHSNDRVYKCRSTIRQILGTLPQDCFIQTHRAYIINKEKIEKFGSQSLVIKKAVIPVSKNFSARLQAALF